MSSYIKIIKRLLSKVSVQGVVTIFIFHYQFSKRKGKYFNTFYHSYSENSSNRATYMAQIYYYDTQSAEINMQSSQSATTPRRLTLLLTLFQQGMDNFYHRDSISCDKAFLE